MQNSLQLVSNRTVLILASQGSQILNDSPCPPTNKMEQIAPNPN